MADFIWTEEDKARVKPGMYVTVYWLGGRLERVPVTRVFATAAFWDRRERSEYLKVVRSRQGVPLCIADSATLSKSAQCPHTGTSYSVGMAQIIVNGQKVELMADGPLTYREVVELAYPGNGHRVYSVTFARAAGSKTRGILSPGKSVKVKTGTILNVCDTSNA
jgi:hypothetical protein